MIVVDANAMTCLSQVILALFCESRRVQLLLTGSMESITLRLYTLWTLRRQGARQPFGSLSFCGMSPLPSVPTSTLMASISTIAPSAAQPIGGWILASREAQLPATQSGHLVQTLTPGSSECESVSRNPVRRSGHRHKACKLVGGSVMGGSLVRGYPAQSASTTFNLCRLPARNDHAHQPQLDP